MDFVKDHKELSEKTNEQEGMSLGEVRQQSRAVCQSVQDLVPKPKD